MPDAPAATSSSRNATDGSDRSWLVGRRQHDEEEAHGCSVGGPEVDALSVQTGQPHRHPLEPVELAMRNGESSADRRRTELFAFLEGGGDLADGHAHAVGRIIRDGAQDVVRAGRRHAERDVALVDQLGELHVTARA